MEVVPTGPPEVSPATLDVGDCMAMEVVPTGPPEVSPATTMEGESGGAETLEVSYEAAKDIARAMANDVVAAVLRRSEYEALKVLAWRFPHGTHVTAMSTTQDNKDEHHAIYVSSEEVIHKRWPDGHIVSESWISFMMRYPRWRIEGWPSNAAHGDDIVQRARTRIGEVEGYNDILYNSEHFTEECYTGISTSSKTNAGAKTIGGCTTASSATGAAIALPFAYSTTTVYALGVIPIGTATVFSGGVVVVGALIGAAVGSTVLAPTLWSWRRSAREASLGRLPFCILNQSGRHLRVFTYRFDDTYRWVAVMGMAGQSSGEVAPQRILELDPSVDADEFQIEVAFGEAAAPPPETWMGSAASVAYGAGSLAVSLVPRLPYISAAPVENLRAVVRRGGVFRISEPSSPGSPAVAANISSQSTPTTVSTPQPETAPAKLLELLRVPQAVLPAYGPPWMYE